MASNSARARPFHTTYDAENRLKEFFADKTDEDPTAVYEYDGNGNRVRKIVDPEGDAIETIFVYNGGGQLVAEYSTELAQAPKVSYLTQDHLGSTRVITDENGEVVSRHDYLAYGEEVTDVVAPVGGTVGGRIPGQAYGAADEIRKKYTGYERDDESGLDYAKARYYDSFRGRYTSVDPLTASADVKNPQTFNRYTYVLNSPYKFTDPLGLISADTGACGSWCPGSNGWGGGLIDPYRAEGSTIQVGREVWYRQQQQEPPPPAQDGIVRPEEVTPTVVIGGEVTSTIDGETITGILPEEVGEALQEVAETAEQLSVAQTRNSGEALEAVAYEYEYRFAQLNPISYELGMMPDQNFKASNGNIMLPEPPEVGVTITVGPVQSAPLGAKSAYSEATVNLVNAANSQLAEIRKINDSGSARNFANDVINRYGGGNGVIKVALTKGGSATIDRGGLERLYKEAVHHGFMAAEKR